MKHKLSLRSAILINFNTMFGAGIFINTVNLAKYAGILGFVSYMVSAVILTPLMVSMANILRYHPSGGMYVYGKKELGTWAGFVSAWCYFFGKLSSAILLVHVFSLLIQTIITPLQAINPLALDFIILSLFMWLNSHNIKTSSKIMYFFLFVKLVPITFAILSSIYLFNHWSAPPETFLWSGIPATIPLVLYAFVGFEVACSLSSLIEDSEVNGPKAISYSFGLSILITIIYQLLVFLAIGPELMAQSSFLDVFPTFFKTIFTTISPVRMHLLNLLHIASASAAIGGSYGMIFSNTWNFHILAQHKHLLHYNWFTKLNEYHIPLACVFAQGVIGFSLLFFTNANQIALQLISVFGVTIGYTISMLALLHIYKKRNFYGRQFVFALLGLASSIIMIGTCLKHFSGPGGMKYVFMLATIILSGLIMYYVTPGSKEATSVSES